jgi:homopolymeric O-antigen transport system permease protein
MRVSEYPLPSDVKGFVPMRFVWMKELWSYRELLYFFAWRDIKLRYRQTVLGASWAVLQPLLTTVIFTILFGRVARLPSEGIPYTLFAYSGVLVWIFFSASITGSASSMVGNASLIRKIYFPRAAIPLASIIAYLLDLAVGLVILIGMMAFYKISPTWRVLVWPLLLVQLIVLALGFGLIFAALNVRYRDVKHAVPFVVQIWMYLTPIIYPYRALPARYRLLVALNPVSGIVEEMRAVLFGIQMPDPRLLELSLVMTAFILVIGLTYFRSAERAFADVI